MHKLHRKKGTETLRQLRTCRARASDVPFVQERRAPQKPPMSGVWRVTDETKDGSEARSAGGRTAFGWKPPPWLQCATTYNCFPVPGQGSPPKTPLFASTVHACLPMQAALRTASDELAEQGPSIKAGHVPEGVPNDAKRIAVIVAPASSHCAREVLRPGGSDVPTWHGAQAVAYALEVVRSLPRQ